jgi:hypothetical protein
MTDTASPTPPAEPAPAVAAAAPLAGSTPVNERLQRLFRASTSEGRIHPLFRPLRDYRLAAGRP